MIICNCNCISDKDFKVAAQRSAGMRGANGSENSIKNCFSALDKKPNCGRCFNGVQNIIDNVRADYEAAAQIKKSVA